jgi:soluble P-type ATPase
MSANNQHTEGLRVDIPRRGKYHLSNVVLDVNGTICLDSELIPDVGDALRNLALNFTVHFITADTHGTMSEIQKDLGVTMQRLTRGPDEAEQKAELIRLYGYHWVNGR